MVILDAITEKLRGACFSSHDLILETRFASRAALVIDHFPHASPDLFKLVGADPLILEKIRLDVLGCFLLQRTVLGGDLFDQVRLKDRAPVGHGGPDDRHLQRSRQDIALSDGCVCRVSWAPAFAGTCLCQP